MLAGKRCLGGLSFGRDDRVAEPGRRFLGVRAVSRGLPAVLARLLDNDLAVLFRRRRDLVIHSPKRLHRDGQLAPHGLAEPDLLDAPVGAADCGLGIEGEGHVSRSALRQQRQLGVAGKVHIAAGARFERRDEPGGQRRIPIVAQLDSGERPDCVGFGLVHIDAGRPDLMVHEGDHHGCARGERNLRGEAVEHLRRGFLGLGFIRGLARNFEPGAAAWLESQASETHRAAKRGWGGGRGGVERTDRGFSHRRGLRETQLPRLLLGIVLARHDPGRSGNRNFGPVAIIQPC